MARKGGRQIPPLILWIVSQYKDDGMRSARADVQKTDGLFSKFKKMIGGLKGDFGSAGQAAAGFGKSLGGALGALGIGLSVVSALRGAIGVFQRYDDGLKTIQRQTGATADEMARLVSFLPALRDGTVFSQTDAVEMLAAMTQEGMDLNTAILTLNDSLKFAQATGLDFASVVGVIDPLLGAMGKEADYASRIFDSMVTSMKETGVSIQTQSDMIGKYAAQLSIYGMEIEEITAITVSLADAGQDSARTMGTVAKVAGELRNKNSDLAKAIRAQGVELTNADGKARNFVEIMDDLGKSFENDSEAVAWLGNNLSDMEATAMAGVIRTSGTMREIWEKNLNSMGTTAEEAAKQAESFSNRMKLMQSASEDLGLMLSDLIAPLIIGLTDIIRENYDSILEFGHNFIGFFRQLGDLLVNLSTGVVGIITTIVDTLGTGAQQIVKFGEVLWKGLTFDFEGSKKAWKEMTKLGSDWATRTKSNILATGMAFSQTWKDLSNLEKYYIPYGSYAGRKKELLAYLDQIRANALKTKKTLTDGGGLYDGLGKGADDAAEKAKRVSDAFASLRDMLDAANPDRTTVAFSELASKIAELRDVVNELDPSKLEAFDKLAAQVIDAQTKNIYKEDADRRMGTASKESDGDLLAYLEKLEALRAEYAALGEDGALALKAVEDEIKKTNQSITQAEADLSIKVKELKKEELTAKLAALDKEMEELRKKVKDEELLAEYEAAKKKAIYEEVAQDWIAKEQEKTGETLRQIRERLKAELAAAEISKTISEAELAVLREKLRLLDEMINKEDRDAEKEQQEKSKEFAESLHDDVEENLSDAILTAMDEGGLAGIEKFGNYMKNKIKKALADAIADALMKQAFGGSIEDFLKKLFSSTGDASGGFFGKLFGGGTPAPPASAPSTPAAPPAPAPPVPTGGTAPAGGGQGGGLGSWFGQMMSGPLGQILGGLGMGASMNGGQMGLGSMLGTGLGMLIPGLGPMFGGLVGGLLDSIFGGGNKEVTVNASGASVEADYVDANFKEGIQTLSSVYKDQTLDLEREMPAPVYSTTVEVKGSVIAERNLANTIEGAAVAGVEKAKRKVGKWEPVIRK